MRNTFGTHKQQRKLFCEGLDIVLFLRLVFFVRAFNFLLSLSCLAACTDKTKHRENSLHTGSEFRKQSTFVKCDIYPFRSSQQIPLGQRAFDTDGAHSHLKKWQRTTEQSDSLSCFRETRVSLSAQDQTSVSARILVFQLPKNACRRHASFGRDSLGTHIARTLSVRETT